MAKLADAGNSGVESCVAAPPERRSAFKMSFSDALRSSKKSSSSSSSSSSTSIIQPNFQCDFLAADLEGQSFDSYMSWCGSFIELYEVPTMHSTVKLVRYYVSDSYRRFMNTMIKFVCYLHDHGKSLHGLNESNLVIVDNWTLKFRGLKFVDTSPNNRKKDFQLIHGIIMNMIQKLQHGYHAIPADLKDFISLMSDYRDSDRDLLLHHFAILPTSLRLELINNFSKKSDFISDKVDLAHYSTAVNNMYRRDIYKEDWTQWFKGSLGEQVGPAKDCFEFVHSNINRGEKYRGTGPPRVVNGDILRFCRNMATHLQDHIPKHTGSKGTELDVDLIIMALFEDELLSFQRLAHENGVLKYFIPGQDDAPASSTKRRQDFPSSSVGPRRQDQPPNPVRRRSGTRPH